MIPYLRQALPAALSALRRQTEKAFKEKEDAPHPVVGEFSLRTFITTAALVMVVGPLQWGLRKSTILQQSAGLSPPDSQENLLRFAGTLAYGHSVKAIPAAAKPKIQTAVEELDEQNRLHGHIFALASLATGSAVLTAPFATKGVLLQFKPELARALHFSELLRFSWRSGLSLRIIDGGLTVAAVFTLTDYLKAQLEKITRISGLKENKTMEFFIEAFAAMLAGGIAGIGGTTLNRLAKQAVLETEVEIVGGSAQFSRPSYLEIFQATLNRSGLGKVLTENAGRNAFIAMLAFLITASVNAGLTTLLNESEDPQAGPKRMLRPLPKPSQTASPVVVAPRSTSSNKRLSYSPAVFANYPQAEDEPPSIEDQEVARINEEASVGLARAPETPTHVATRFSPVFKQVGQSPGVSPAGSPAVEEKERTHQPGITPENALQRILPT